MNRQNALNRLSDTFDVIVIGGGATGLGSAVDAAARGYKTLLLEAHDFAKGTSSRSTKLVHGGVRYLAQGNVSLVREALHERGLLSRNAPHLVRSLGFVIPAYDWWSRPFYGIGLKMYDLLAGRLNIGKSRILGRDEVLESIPTLKHKGLQGGVLYHDGQFDDARLAITLMRTLHDLGGVSLNYAPVRGLIKEHGKVAGVKVQDSETGTEYEVRGKAVINATGVFVDAVRRMDEPEVRPMLSPSQGVHLVLDQEFLPGDRALMIPRTDDGRVLFGVPWHGKVVVGTTDTAVPDVSLEPHALPQEVDFILKTARRYLGKQPSETDIRSIFVGLRPLVKAEGASSTAALSRDHTIRVSQSNLITITGGKWTTYRRMGQDAIDRAIEATGLRDTPHRTEALKLHGHTTDALSEPLKVYGTDAEKVLTLPGADQKLHPDLPYLEAEVRFAVRYEMARTVEDILSRRTRAILLNARAATETASRVAQILREELQTSEQKVSQQVEQFRDVTRQYQHL
ncbi:glycerol-3-phosphate dehydrogenase/oxidase [Deinococcus cellulosilyticus]|uniref:Glycerol-3-phosphate dehydrogenase n=1 Tax=Deinococcus cellulosilyticus (strain DSM 18568 / NBRC 106333 / KACC 11606 / 5516J-15) TaxID=1223518 RepID=A0A511MZH7_DEIC1|nr:glycerol-3-phosphate dehydrogenase/oxidase [Deinococcus cellulosilyticus]GEM45959.1 glycerol-3-phosphate dehydrogenase [Deinococcus cellulosilyticus NBRC 106333 = KACC 11606]